MRPEHVQERVVKDPAPVRIIMDYSFHLLEVNMTSRLACTWSLDEGFGQKMSEDDHHIQKIQTISSPWLRFIQSEVRSKKRV